MGRVCGAVSAVTWPGCHLALHFLLALWVPFFQRPEVSGSLAKTDPVSADSDKGPTLGFCEV
jgi:hypothetical protein